MRGLADHRVHRGQDPQTWPPKNLQELWWGKSYRRTPQMGSSESWIKIRVELGKKSNKISYFMRHKTGLWMAQFVSSNSTDLEGIHFLNSGPPEPGKWQSFTGTWADPNLACDAPILTRSKWSLNHWKEYISPAIHKVREILSFSLWQRLPYLANAH